MKFDFAVQIWELNAQMAQLLRQNSHTRVSVRNEFGIIKGGNYMFQFRQTTTVKKNRQETDGVDRNRFASYFFRADREIRGNDEETDNIFVIAQGLINRERNRVFENPMSIL